MAFIKRGDDIPILEYFDDDGKQEICPKCGAKLIVVALNGENNKLVCQNCDIDEQIDDD